MMKSKHLCVMSYNMRYADDTPPHSWNHRKRLITNLIVKESPDLIGTQECLFRQVRDLEEMLPQYGWVGFGREGGSQGEYMAIFYKKDRLKVKEYGHFWLSETPDRIGSCSWGNICPRMVTWVHFFDTQMNQSFFHFNTHLDHESAKARIEGAKLLIQKASEIAQRLPVIVTGDFNEGHGSMCYQLLNKQFTDTWTLAKRRINDGLGTFNHFQDPTGGEEMIDWILVKGVHDIESAEIIGDCPDGRFPSDHFPIVVELKFAQQEEEGKDEIYFSGSDDQQS